MRGCHISTTIKYILSSFVIYLLVGARDLWNSAQYCIVLLPVVLLQIVKNDFMFIWSAFSMFAKNSYSCGGKSRWGYEIVCPPLMGGGSFRILVWPRVFQFMCWCGLSIHLHCKHTESWCGLAKVGVAMTIPAIWHSPPMASTAFSKHALLVFPFYWRDTFLHRSAK